MRCVALKPLIPLSYQSAIYVMIYNRGKFECGKWRATDNATKYAEAVPASIILVYEGLPIDSVPCSYVEYH